LKGRVPVASHAAAGGGQSNHAEVPRFNLCEREREGREERERAAADGASQAQSERERDGNEGSGRTAAAEDGANHAEGGQAPTAAQANPGGGVLCRGDEINETACTKSTKITTGLRSKFSEYMKST